MVTPGSTLPVESVAVPVNVASWPYEGAAATISNATAIRSRRIDAALICDLPLGFPASVRRDRARDARGRQYYTRPLYPAILCEPEAKSGRSRGLRGTRVASHVARPCEPGEPAVL